jgi:general secretion pathway protein I
MWNWKRVRRAGHGLPAGFTLLEVLVAVAVVAIALVPLLRLHLLSLDATVRAQDLTTAVLLAQGKLATMAPGPTLQTGEEEGAFEDPELVRFRWHTTVTEHVLPPLTPPPSTPGQPAAPPADIKVWHIAVTVRWADGQSERNYTLDTYAVDTSTPASQ